MKKHRNAFSLAPDVDIEESVFFFTSKLKIPYQ